jgi:hypothetical protein
MPYLHDIFISYKRETLWTPWTRDHLKRLLTAYLQQELGDAPDIFVDENITVGADWVNQLAMSLAHSKVMIAVFSGDYFGSDWCLHELDLMLGRSLTHMGSSPNGLGLVIPIVVHDGDRIPTQVCRIQPVDLKKYRVACLNETTPLYQDFSIAIGNLAPVVKAAIDLAPSHQDNWFTECSSRFNQVYQAQRDRRRIEPTNFVAKRPTPPLAPPRMIA